jgi:hypothetical protein
MAEPAWDEETDAGWYRRKVGHRIEKGMNRLLGTVLGAIGLWAAYVTLTSNSFAFATHWFGLVAAAGLLLLARLCFKARRAVVTDLFGGEEMVDISRRPKKTD